MFLIVLSCLVAVMAGLFDGVLPHEAFFTPSSWCTKGHVHEGETFLPPLPGRRWAIVIRSPPPTSSGCHGWVILGTSSC